MGIRKLEKVIASISVGGIGILPTDTIYGIIGSALKPRTINKIYKLRRRNPKKPVIILISKIDDLDFFGIKRGRTVERILSGAWPGKVSVVLPLAPVYAKKFSYLERGTGTLAFRLPRPKWLRDLIAATGPIAAPSANFEGEPPSKTIADAKKYFGRNVDFYIDGGSMDGKPSTLIALKNNRIILLRKGAGKIRL